MSSSETIRIVPQLRTRAQLAAAPAKLVATLLSVATAGLLDAGRFRRGREYASSGAVTELLVSRGSLLGTVQGSRREPYEVEVHTSVVAAPNGGAVNVQALTAVTPDADDLHPVCTCPDAADSVCKHAAAVLLAFAEEAGDRPELLVAWRCGDVPAADRATIGSRRWGAAARGAEPLAGGGAAGRGAVGRDAGPPSPFATPAWHAFVDFPSPLPADGGIAASLGAPAEPAGPAEPAATSDSSVARALGPLGTERLGAFDLAAMIRSAQQAMRAAGNDIV